MWKTSTVRHNVSMMKLTGSTRLQTLSLCELHVILMTFKVVTESTSGKDEMNSWVWSFIRAHIFSFTFQWEMFLI